MIIAVPYDKGDIFQHFGHTSEFKLYEVNFKDYIVSTKIVQTNGSGHGALSAFLAENGVNKLICGGIGAGAKTALAEKNIEIFGGVTGNADQSVDELLAGRLKYDPNKVCSHHHEDGHDCGEDHQGCSGCGNEKPSITSLKPGSLLKKN
ncbi:MAG: NifB/NifX family molybdenum-iron cluster-binding protein [Candidatus Riflebacteria bacterium]|nr:NifB/NifX family molybdenum-iron cluster-binding protein [Candidatus Riflebacteria bacterium]